MIVWFDEAEYADKAIEKGIMWKCDLKATEIFKSGFRMMQCYNFQKYGHIAKNCSVESKCGHCAGGHNTRTCPGKQEIRCSNCGKKHKAWDPICPVRLVAKARAVQNRTQDLGRFVTQELQAGDLDSEWQIVGSRKRRASLSATETVNPVGESNTRLGPGRARKTPAFVIPDISTTLSDLITIASTPTALTQIDTRTVVRENETVTTDAPESEMTS
ncbi:putative zinc finger cchc-type protein [Erysiphe necator]|uniref:Putative zinc finger cchc-type protein n=1 Tax=Uncinula necator TaxID=52586 RepID=A0A0B1P9Z6_UNCNE|nr:putative zinc finger cchc-type protein [Erysiphe necator]